MKVEALGKSKRRPFDQVACFVEDTRVVFGNNIEGRGVVDSVKPPGRCELSYIKYTTLALHFQANLRRI